MDPNFNFVENHYILGDSFSYHLFGSELLFLWQALTM